MVELIACLMLRPCPNLVLSRIRIQRKLDLDPAVVQHLRLRVGRTVHVGADEDDAVGVCAEGDVVVAAVEDDGRGGVDGEATAERFDEDFAVCGGGEEVSDGDGEAVRGENAPR